MSQAFWRGPLQGETSVQKNTHILFLDFDGVLHPDAVYLCRPLWSVEKHLAC